MFPLTEEQEAIFEKEYHRAYMFRLSHSIENEHKFLEEKAEFNYGLTKWQQSRLDHLNACRAMREKTGA